MHDRKSYKSLPEITHLLSFAILLVEFGHSRIAIDASANPDFYWFIWKVIYSFHMHLFMFVSGFLFIHTNLNKDHFNFSKFIFKKIKRLLVPYFTLMFVAFLIRLALSNYVVRQLQPTDFLIMFIHSKTAAIDYYWFIMTLFIVFLFSPVLFYSIKHNSKVGMVLITFALIYLNLNPINTLYFFLHKVSNYFLYFWIGCCFCRYKEKLLPLFSNFTIAMPLFIALIGLNSIQHRFIFLDIFKALTGILLSVTLIQIYCRKQLRIFRWINGYYYQIFLMSWFFHKGVEFFLHRILDLGFYVVFPISFFSSMFFSVNIAKFINKHIPRLNPIIGL